MNGDGHFEGKAGGGIAQGFQFRGEAIVLHPHFGYSPGSLLKQAVGLEHAEKKS
jgi:hypothetical protein